MSLKNKQYRSEEGKNVHLQMTEKLANARNNGLKLCKKKHLFNYKHDMDCG